MPLINFGIKCHLIFAQLFSEPFHRGEFFKESIPFLNNVASTLLNLFRIPVGLDWTLFYNLPFVIFLVPLIILSFFSRK